MTSVRPAPIYQPMIEDEGGIAALPWILFFDQIFKGDTGTSWTPQFISLTVTGAAPTITGIYYQITRKISFFRVKIVPGTDTSAVAGTTFINNYPLTMSGDGICFAVSGLLGTNSGMCDQASNNIYVPAWTTVTVPLSIIGLVEAS